MGTTVTPNLALIMPDEDESIKEALPTFPGWASQNGTNCDKTDALFRKTTNTYAATWTAASVNPTLGSGGFVEGKYIRLFPRLVVGFFRIFAGGAGFAGGTGVYQISLPFAMDPLLATQDNTFPIGKAILFDNDSVVNSQNMLVTYDIVVSAIKLRPCAGGSWSPTTPFTLAQNDRVSGYFMYPTKDA